jgi:hypothetical protein
MEVCYGGGDFYYSLNVLQKVGVASHDIICHCRLPGGASLELERQTWSCKDTLVGWGKEPVKLQYEDHCLKRTFGLHIGAPERAQEWGMYGGECWGYIFWSRAVRTTIWRLPTRTMIIWWISDSITKPNHVDLGCQGSRNASTEGGNRHVPNKESRQSKVAIESRQPKPDSWLKSHAMRGLDE